MQKALLIAEKASMANDIEEGYKHYKHKKFDITFMAASGHLAELYLPNDYSEEWVKWDMNVLPIIPREFKKKISKGKATIFKELKNEINSGKYDIIINAGDPGREGELIIDEILELSGNKLPEFRLWGEDLSVEGVCKAFDNLLMPQYNLKKAAKLRMYEDWLIGINSSRAGTLSTQLSLSAGRVMSVVLAMVAIRDIERATFKPRDYYECEFNILTNKGSFVGLLMNSKDKVAFDNDEDIKDIISRADVEGTVLEITKEIDKEKAPLLHDLGELQKEAYSEFGFTPDKVLELAQSLYEKKILSYPRTDSRYLSENVASELKDNLVALSTIPGLANYVSHIISNPTILASICSSKNKYVNNAKLTDHHAIIPTKVRAVFAELTNDEIKIYLLVARRLIALFLPERVVQKTKIICGFGDAVSVSKGKVLLEAGYSAIIPIKSEDVFLPDLNKGDKVSLDSAELVEKKTKPPAAYNYNTLIDAMLTAGKFVEDANLARILKDSKGIGTAATRSDVIKKLKKIKYITDKGGEKKGTLTTTELGMAVYESIKDTDLVKVETTALIEQQLKEVENGRYDAEVYARDMIQYVYSITNQLKQLEKSPYADKLENSKNELKCPICGKNIKVSSKYYYCEGRSEDTCSFVLAKEHFGAKINQDDFAKLLNGEVITKKFTWKSNKQSDAKIMIALGDNKRYMYKFLF